MEDSSKSLSASGPEAVNLIHWEEDNPLWGLISALLEKYKNEFCRDKGTGQMNSNASYRLRYAREKDARS